jgi:hypothetical protein
VCAAFSHFTRQRWRWWPFFGVVDAGRRTAFGSKVQSQLHIQLGNSLTAAGVHWQCSVNYG